MKCSAPPSPHSCTLCPVLHSLSPFDSSLTKHRWAGVTVCWAPRGHVRENEAALYTDATFHVKHIPLREGGQLLQSVDHLFSNSPLFPDPRQLAAISCQDRT